MFSPSDITVYVPYFNAARTIARCSDSLKNQSITPFEIIIINDGSEEPLPSSVKIRVINHSGNKGLSAARNTALNACQTRLIASIDADVVAEKDWLENLLKALNETGAAGVGGRMNEHYQNNLGDRWRAVHMAQNWGGKSVKNPRFLFGANTLFKVKDLKNAGGYNENLRTNNEDRTISDSLYKIGKSLFYEASAGCSHLRQDKTETILSAYWGWHHAKGMLEGDFDTVEGILGRIGRVNFGIGNYRYNLDEENKRKDFQLLDLLIPYVFCCRDIILFCKKTDSVLPNLAELAACMGLEGTDFLQSFIPPLNCETSSNSWFDKYLDIYRSQLKEFMTVEKLKALDFEGWLSENIDRVFEKKR